MSYWLSIMVFWEISQMFNQSRSSQACRKFPFSPVGCGDHGEISSLIQAIIHNVHYMQVSEIVCAEKILITHYLISSPAFYRYQWCGAQSGCGKVWGQGHCRGRSLFLHASIPLFSHLSLSCLHSWRHTLHTEATLGKFWHIVLSHPMRKLSSLWTSVFHLQLDKWELVDSGAVGSSLSYIISHF